MKLERYKRSRILRVVIRPEIIKIDKEKIKEVLDWPTSKGVRIFRS